MKREPFKIGDQVDVLFLLMREEETWRPATVVSVRDRMVGVAYADETREWLRLGAGLRHSDRPSDPAYGLWLKARGNWDPHRGPLCLQLDKTPEVRPLSAEVPPEIVVQAITFRFRDMGWVEDGIGVFEWWNVYADGRLIDFVWYERRGW